MPGICAQVNPPPADRRHPGTLLARIAGMKLENPRRRCCADLCAIQLSVYFPTAVLPSLDFQSKSPAIFARRIVGQSCKPPTQSSLSSPCQDMLDGRIRRLHAHSFPPTLEILPYQPVATLPICISRLHTTGGSQLLCLIVKTGCSCFHSFLCSHVY